MRTNIRTGGIHTTWKFKLISLVGLSIVVSILTGDSFAQEKISFNQQVRPILADICFNCHGPDAAANEGGMRLDSFEAATGEGDSGNKTIVPGDGTASELVQRIFDKDDPMPPVDFQKQLTNEQKRILKSWVEQGANYEGHWAFVAPARPEIPSVKQPEWTKNPIDHFVLAKLEANRLKPSPQATPETLIRRLALDLTGLPPTPTEVKNFLQDVSNNRISNSHSDSANNSDKALVNDGFENAYEKIVDYYLASPRYGEKMAIPWLDYARYADSNGFQSDDARNVWAWREWVIKAYNRNLPFDQFTIEQIAGDMLDNPTHDQIVATGFNRNHRLNGEGGRIVDEWFVETVIDRVETTGMTWLGLTFNCCRCHDHKYDPISQKEFYQMFAFFNSNEESGVLAGNSGGNTAPLLPLMTPELDQKIADFESKIAQAKTKAQELLKSEPELIAQWAKTISTDALEEKPDWRIVKPKSIEADGGVKFKRQQDGSYLAAGKNPDKSTYVIQLPLEGQDFTGLMVEAFQDNRLPHKFLGRSKSNGNFVLTDIEVVIKTPDGAEAPGPEVTVKFEKAKADFEQPNWPAAKVIEDADTSVPQIANKGWATIGFKPDGGKPNRIMFVTREPVKTARNSIATIKLFHRSPYAKHTIGRIRFQLNSDSPENVTLGKSGPPKQVLAILKKPADERSFTETKQLASFFRQEVPSPIKDANAEAAKLKAQLKDFRNRLPTTMVMKEGKKRDAFILERGEYDKIGAKVERGLPDFLPKMPDGQPMDRLGLANWIVDESNPLTSRVWVNRTWENLFGVGIVKSTENFGTQADFPTHPELLDWLAVEFRSPKFLPAVSGVAAKRWDMKAFIKLVVMSATYRQSSAVSVEMRERDPTNQWLSRGPRFRLSGEVIRDQALSASGLLVNKIGGPSVRPYMPEGVWDETSVYGNLRNYKPDKGDGLYRRSLYTIWKRTAGPPSMLLFDAPNRETCTVRRSKTNTPLQALSLLNEITFVEASQALALRMIREGGKTESERLTFGFKVLTSRVPTKDELGVLTDGLRDDVASFKNNPNDAKAFLKSVNIKYVEGVEENTIPELAAYSLAANVMLNLDEVVMRE